MEQFRFTFDGTTVVDNPKNWENIKPTIVRRIDVFKGCVLNYVADVEFAGDAYTYLRQAYSDGYCGKVEVLVELSQQGGQPYTTFFEGLIILKDIKFNVSHCIAKTTIKDNNFTAIIETNKRVKAKLTVGYSKNADFSEDPNITPVTPVSIELLLPDTNPPSSYTPAENRDLYLVNDAFRFLIDFMTDGTVDYISDYFGSGGEKEGVGILTGTDLRTGLGISVPDISFEDLFTQLDKKYTIGISLEESAGTPVIRIQPISTLFTSTVVATFSDVQELQVYTDQTNFYARVDVGAADNLDTVAGGTALPVVRFLTFEEEDYGVIGDCNLDKILDLVSDWIVSNNVIYDIVLNGNSDYDDNIVLLEADLATNETLHTDIFGDQSYWTYNGSMTNKNAVNNAFQGIPNSIQKFLGSNDNTFRALKTADQSVPGSFTLMAFEDDTPPEGDDPNGNYTNTAGNYKYTAPVNGVYTFELDVLCTSSATPVGGGIAFEIRRYNSGATLVATDAFAFAIFANPTTFNRSVTFFLDTGDYVQIYASKGALPSTITLSSGSTFRCSATIDGGGIYTPTQDVLRYKALEFRTPITWDQAISISQNTKGKIVVTSNGITTYGWLNKLEYEIGSQIADILLITDDTSI